MSLKDAIRTGDLSLLPSRRDEDWRWTDLRGAVRELKPPEPLPPQSGAIYAPEPPWPWVERKVGGWPPLDGGIDPVLGLTWPSTRFNTPSHQSHRIVVPKDASSVLLEFHGSYAESYVVSHELEIDLAPGARFERIVVTDETDGGVIVSQARVKLAEHAAFSQTVITTGAKRHRIETRVDHPGAGATVRMDGLYLVGAKRHADITTVVEHAGAGGSTNELVKGVVAGQGRGVFQGRIVVAKGADQTDARMGHHALILSDRGEVDAKPELLIFADDVACAHGNTVGALDENALFYARQRGIPEAEAKALLTEAFVGEVIDRIEHEGARDACRVWVAEKLRGLQ